MECATTLKNMYHFVHFHKASSCSATFLLVSISLLLSLLMVRDCMVRSVRINLFSIFSPAAFNSRIIDWFPSFTAWRRWSYSSTSVSSSPNTKANHLPRLVWYVCWTFAFGCCLTSLTPYSSGFGAEVNGSLRQTLFLSEMGCGNRLFVVPWL